MPNFIMRYFVALISVFTLLLTYAQHESVGFQLVPMDEALHAGKRTFLKQYRGKNERGKKPNIVYIVADDLGKHDLSVYGNHLIHTPNIDNLAREGVMCTDGYATASVCSPSRAGMLTGRYQQRFGYHLQPHQRYAKNKFQWWWFRNLINTSYMTPTDYVLPPRKEHVTQFGLPQSEIALSELFKAAGYATAWIGKWHLGYHEGFLPKDFGFDYRYGCLEAYTLFADPKDKAIVNARIKEFTDKVIWKGARDGHCAIYENDVLVDEKEYLTYAFARRAIKFIDAHKEEPFFLYLPVTAPHTPYQAPKVIYDTLGHIPQHSTRVYYAMVVALDEMVGQLVNHLEQLNLLENTLIVFTSDNGAALYSETVTNYPLSGGKMTLFEGGINVPLILYKKNDFPQQKVLTHGVNLLDVFATIVDLAGISLPDDRPYDGESLLRWIYASPEDAPHDYLYWLSDYNMAIRNERFKLLINKRDKTILLYDLIEDRSELKDVKAEQAELVRALQQALEVWMAEMPPLYWPRIMDYAVEINGVRHSWAV
jgi:arylsulfatase A-like enzyme